MLGHTPQPLKPSVLTKESTSEVADLERMHADIKWCVGLVLKVFLALLPWLLSILGRLQGLHSKSIIDFSVISKFFIFQARLPSPWRPVAGLSIAVHVHVGAKRLPGFHSVSKSFLLQLKRSHYSRTTQALPNKAAACSAAWEFAGLMFRKEDRFAAAGSGKLNGHALFADYPPQLLG